MAIKLHIPENDPRMQPLLGEVKRVATEAARKLAPHLPKGNIDVVIYANPEGTIRELGIGGYTPVENTVFVSLDLGHKHLKKNLKKELTYTLAHELHHAVRFRTPIAKETLLEAMISEGLADHFAMRLTGSRQSPAWCRALTEAEQNSHLKKAKRLWNEETYNRGLWFYGTDPKKVKRWAAYTLGYDLVAMYIKKHREFDVTKDFAVDASLFA